MPSWRDSKYRSPRRSLRRQRRLEHHQSYNSGQYPHAFLEAITDPAISMNEAALWIAQHEDQALARDRAHRALDILLTSVVPNSKAIGDD